MKKFHICLAGDNGVHFQRWLNGLSKKDNYKLSAVTMHSGTEVAGVDYYYLDKHTHTKADYILNILQFKKLINRIKPDILHCHYASGYGLLGAMSGYHPYFLSVWGSDVVSFPANFFTEQIIKYTLKQTDEIFATSEYLKKITSAYCDKAINVINFGIDTDIFSPADNNRNELVAGTVKSLHPQYGIHNLIAAYKLLENEDFFYKTKLMIVGGGEQEAELKRQVSDSGLDKKVMFTGRVDHSEVAEYHNRIDVFIAVSLDESFGVAVLEAESCCKPVIVSDIGGLPEVVEDGVTGFIVPVNDPQSTAVAMKRLLSNENLRKEMGKRGRELVLRKFRWKNNIDEMCSFYNKYL